MFGTHTLPTSNAKNWYNANHGYVKRNADPIPPCIGCFDAGSYGHVVFVEDFDGDVIQFSEANWYGSSNSRLSNGEWEPSPAGTDGDSKAMALDIFKDRSGTGAFQGFILLQ